MVATSCKRHTTIIPQIMYLWATLNYPTITLDTLSRYTLLYLVLGGCIQKCMVAHPFAWCINSLSLRVRKARKADPYLQTTKQCDIGFHMRNYTKRAPPLHLNHDSTSTYSKIEFLALVNTPTLQDTPPRHALLTLWSMTDDLTIHHSLETRETRPTSYILFASRPKQLNPWRLGLCLHPNKDHKWNECVLSNHLCSL